MTQSALIFPDSKKGYTCPCCGGYVKTYIRKFNSNMALALGILYKWTNGDNFGKFCHLENLIIESGYKRCGDFSYLVHYAFIEKFVGKREDGSARNGHYRITPRGMMFVEGKCTAPEKFIMDGGKFRGFDGENITFSQALGSKFNFNELMQR